ncbi:pyrroline-5-carboxylate reductase [Nitrosococcus watsonii]|uniref:Pyrroline-5-carboxylate reductase n=1 Tax=Nitrosococcus watsoni (strain C-113) TaxID=105559 RepID=D8KCA8_NITWC|nr:pyrroline-5-carboxylate reductase [Nitrosococcus watsonii]ADJ29779.1 pyrroline-5-carboxylate reductase [Nitrosococcus watsonii C-113]
MSEQTLAFIGGGNMAASLIGGLVADGRDAQAIWVADPDRRKLDALHERFGVNTAPDNIQVAQDAAIIVLAVKPQQLRSVVTQLKNVATLSQPLWLTIAAGIGTPDVEAWLGGPAPIVRAMPNTPALVQAGATALFANPHTSPNQRQTAESVLRAVGLTLWLNDENLMEVVTALSGGGPAYFFLVMEAMEKAAIDLGLESNTARLLTLETAFGAAKMALKSEEGCASLRQRVTSPGGTTERAIAALEEANIRKAFARALQAARDRARELAQELGSKHA